MRTCKKCKIEKEETEFYKAILKGGTIYKRYVCKRCFYNRMNEVRTKKRNNVKPKLELYLENQVTEYHSEPNMYKTEEQKHNVFVLMTIMGWKFKDGVWYKDKIKEEGNYWPKIHIKKKGEFIMRKPYKKYNPFNKRHDLREPEVVEEIVRLKDQGMSYEKLSIKYTASTCVIRSIYLNEKAKK